MEGQKKIFPHLFWSCCWIQDLGFEIRDPEWIKIRNRDQHPTSTTLSIRVGSALIDFIFIFLNVL
jgi:hypothetical protein